MNSLHDLLSKPLFSFSFPDLSSSPLVYISPSKSLHDFYTSPSSVLATQKPMRCDAVRHRYDIDIAVPIMLSLSLLYQNIPLEYIQL